MIVKALKSLLFVLALSSCVHSELDRLNTDSWREDIDRMALAVESEYEFGYLCYNMSFWLYNSDIENEHLIKETFSDLIWVVPEAKIRLSLFDRNREDHARVYVKKKWEQGFTKPGVYSSILVGYRGDKVVYSEKRVIKISSRIHGDFLNFDWKEIDYNQRYPLISSVATNDSPFYYLTKQEMEGIEVVNLYYTSYTSLWNLPEYSLFLEKEQKQDLYQLLTDAYYLPRYSYTKDPIELQAAYRRYFPKDSLANPIHIWYTPMVKVVMLEQNTAHGDTKKHFCRAVLN